MLPIQFDRGGSFLPPSFIDEARCEETAVIAYSLPEFQQAVAISQL